MKRKLLLLVSVVVLTSCLTVMVYANDYETDKIPVSNSTTKTTTYRYEPGETTTTPKEDNTTTKRRPIANLMDLWSIDYYNEEADGNSFDLDVVNDGIINAKDYAKINNEYN